MRGDLAVTGATGEALAIVRRRCAPARRAADRRRRRRPCSGWTATRSTVELPRLGADRRGAAGPPPGRQRRGRGRAARRARGGRDRARCRRGGTAAGLRDRPLAGPPGAARGRRPGAAGRCCSTAPTTRTGPRRWRDGARRPAPAPRRGRRDAAGAAHARLGGRWRTRTSTGRHRRRGPIDAPWPARRSSAPPWTCRGRMAARGPRRAPGARRLPRWATVLTAPDPAAALDAGPRTGRRGRWSSPARCTSSAPRAPGSWTTRPPGPGAGMSDRRPAAPRGGRRRPERPKRAAGRRRPRSGCRRVPDPACRARRADSDRPATFAWGERTFVMGILNVTPDSFSGDGLLAAAGRTRSVGGRVAPGPADGRRRAPTSSTSAARPAGPGHAPGRRPRRRSPRACR